MSLILFKFQSQPDLHSKFQTRQGYRGRHLQSQHLGVRGRKIKSSRPVRLCLKSSWVSLLSLSAYGVAEMQCHSCPAGGSVPTKRRYGGMGWCWILSRTIYLLLELSFPRTPCSPVQPLPLSSDTARVLISQFQSPCCENSTSIAGPGPEFLRVCCRHTDQNGPGPGPWSRCSEQSDWRAAAGSRRQAVWALPPQRSPAGWTGQGVSGTA